MRDDESVRRWFADAEQAVCQLDTITEVTDEEVFAYALKRSLMAADSDSGPDPRRFLTPRRSSWYDYDLTETSISGYRNHQRKFTDDDRRRGRLVLDCCRHLLGCSDTDPARRGTAGRDWSILTKHTLGCSFRELAKLKSLLSAKGRPMAHTGIKDRHDTARRRIIFKLKCDGLWWGVQCKPESPSSRKSNKSKLIPKPKFGDFGKYQRLM